MKEFVFNQYAESILKYMGITKEELFTKNKTREIVQARQMLYYLCRSRGFTVSLILKCMTKNGYKIDRTSVLYGISKFESLIENDPDYNIILKKVIEIGG